MRRLSNACRDAGDDACRDAVARRGADSVATRQRVIEGSDRAWRAPHRSSSHHDARHRARCRRVDGDGVHVLRVEGARLRRGVPRRRAHADRERAGAPAPRCDRCRPRLGAVAAGGARRGRRRATSCRRRRSRSRRPIPRSRCCGRWSTRRSRSGWTSRSTAPRSSDRAQVVKLLQLTMFAIVRRGRSRTAHPGGGGRTSSTSPRGGSRRHLTPVSGWRRDARAWLTAGRHGPHPGHRRHRTRPTTRTPRTSTASSTTCSRRSGPSPTPASRSRRSTATSAPAAAAG